MQFFSLKGLQGQPVNVTSPVPVYPTNQRLLSIRKRQRESTILRLTGHDCRQFHMKSHNHYTIIALALALLVCIQQGASANPAPTGKELIFTRSLGQDVSVVLQNGNGRLAGPFWEAFPLSNGNVALYSPNNKRYSESGAAALFKEADTPQWCQVRWSAWSNEGAGKFKGFNVIRWRRVGTNMYPGAKHDGEMQEVWSTDDLPISTAMRALVYFTLTSAPPSGLPLRGIWITNYGTALKHVVGSFDLASCKPQSFAASDCQIPPGTIKTKDWYSVITEPDRLELLYQCRQRLTPHSSQAATH